MAFSETEREWYYAQIEKLDPEQNVVSIDRKQHLVSYTPDLKSDESSHKDATPEECVRALITCILTIPDFNYPVGKLYREKLYQHGRKGTLSDRVDLLIYDDDSLPYAMWEIKSSEKYEEEQDDSIELQLFGTAPLVGTPKLLVYATIKPVGEEPSLTLVCIDYTKHRSYDAWVEGGQSHSLIFPYEYRELGYEPFTYGGEVDLRTDCTQAEFRSAALTFHNEFFGEHPDNVLFVNLMKCLLAKIFDERNTKKGEVYKFQVFYRGGKEESAQELFDRINTDLYSPAYQRYIEPKATSADEINPKEFSPEKVKTVVKVLQAMSLTRGAALHGDIIGSFFEEILRAGFKQDKGMYFTHDNLVEFMLEAVDVRGLVIKTWKAATHPDNRLPYVIDPACGSGSFLLKVMRLVSETINEHKDSLVIDFESEQFYNARMSPSMPNYWAEHFLYGLDPKFIMAITAKVNMVLHGDGSAHIFKQDAFKPLSTFPDSRFRPAGDSERAVPESRYPYEVCETFDLVVSNPPFGITLASDTRATLSKTFHLRSTCASEELFLERCFQLLKHGGRLAIVVPESLLNTAASIETRLFLYRAFWIRAIVSLPRNVFIDTPTLTSLLFAEKKTSEEIWEWDSVWEEEKAKADLRIKKAKQFLAKAPKQKSQTAADIQESVIEILSPIVSEDTWVIKRGRNPAIVRFSLPSTVADAKEAINYYRDMLKLTGFHSVVKAYVFDQLVEKINYDFPVFIVDEVGYKLSKRKERVRPNQLCRFIGDDSGGEQPNLHLAAESYRVEVNVEEPHYVLDYIKRHVRWE